LNIRGRRKGLMSSSLTEAGKRGRSKNGTTSKGKRKNPKGDCRKGKIRWLRGAAGKNDKTKTPSLSSKKKKSRSQEGEASKRKLVKGEQGKTS